MSDFSERFGYSKPSPPRTLLKTDTEQLRGVLWQLLTRRGADAKAGYQRMRQLLGLAPDSDVWSPESFEARAAGDVR